MCCYLSEGRHAGSHLRYSRIRPSLPPHLCFFPAFVAKLPGLFPSPPKPGCSYLCTYSLCACLCWRVPLLFFSSCFCDDPTVTGKLAEMFASPDLLRWISTQKMGFLGSTIMISIRCCCISMKYMQVAAFSFSLATGGLPGQLGGPPCLYSHVWLSIRGGKRESKYRAPCLWALKSASSRDGGWALANSMSMRSPRNPAILV